MKALSALRLAAAVGIAVSAATSAQATLWSWNWTPSSPQPVGGSYGYNAAGGSVEFINSTFNDATKQLTFDIQFQGTLTTRGFWLVINNGPDPKNQPGNYALFYFDATSFAAPKLTAYGYNGQNNGSSFQDGNGSVSGNQAPDLIKGINEAAGFVNSISAGDSAGKRRFQFSVNATGIINRAPLYPAPDSSAWEGTGFGNKLGIWMHTLANGVSFSYDNTRGGITAFNKGSSEGWLDGNNFQTIPTPGATALLGLGGLLVARRRRAA